MFGYKASSRKTNIKIVGIGSGGNLVINQMISQGIKGPQYINLDTNYHFLSLCRAHQKLTMSQNSGSPIEISQIMEEAARNNRDYFLKMLKGSDVVIIVAALGGSVGSSLAPIVAEAAVEVNAVTIGAVTKPLTFGLKDRLIMAEKRVAVLKERVHTLIMVQNDVLQEKMGRTAVPADIFRLGDEMLIRGIQALITTLTCGEINSGRSSIAFTEVRSFSGNPCSTELKDFLKKGSTAFIGTGSASGKRKTIEAAKAAIIHCLTEKQSREADYIILNVTRGKESWLLDVNLLLKMAKKAFSEEAKIFFADTILNRDMGGEVNVTVIAGTRE
ncbi:MAG TPA: hypothetical protein DEA47_04640 [Peptococcaceae bacterium]|nr:MAG: Cell division protein FtsZ [Clostridia bacterium 41_269]HBT20632.1 hypothetical protein [Peptococcaceae bacterium]